MNYQVCRAFCVAVAVSFALAACSSSPKPTGQLSSYDGLGDEEGILSKQRNRAEPSILKATTKVRIQTTTFASGALPEGITEKEAAFVSQRLSYSLCRALSGTYSITAEPGPGVLDVRAVVTELKLTNQTAAGATVAASFVNPLPIGRIPIGFGGLIVEGEAVTPNASGAPAQAAAILWSKTADPILSSSSISKIGDSFNYADEFADDFASLLIEGRKAESEKRLVDKLPLPTMASLSKPFRNDPACNAFGKTNIGADLFDAVSPIPLPLKWRYEAAPVTTQG